MAFSTSNIVSNYKPARTNLFEVSVIGPALTGVLTPLSVPLRFFKFRVSDVEMPGKNIMTMDHKYYGPVQKIAYNTSYADLTMGVLVSEDQAEVEFFNKWQDLIGGDHRRRNTLDSSAFDVTYYDLYKSSIFIECFGSSSDEPTREVELVDAYPILISPISLSWNNQEVMKLNVTMTYRYWRDRKVELKPTPQDDELEVGLGETSAQFSGAKTVAQRTQEGVDVIDRLIAQGKVVGQ